MKPSSINQKKPLRIAFLATAIVAIVAVIFIVLEERNINRYEYDEKWYQKEEERFNKVLEEASDEELLIVLKYAIIMCQDLGTLTRSSLAYKYFGTPLLWRYILMQGLSLVYEEYTVKTHRHLFGVDVKKAGGLPKPYPSSCQGDANDLKAGREQVASLFLR